MFIGISFLKNFAIFTTKHLYWSLLLIKFQAYRQHSHGVKSVWSVFSYIRTEYGYPQISVFSPNTGKHGPEKTQYSDTFHAVLSKKRLQDKCFPLNIAKFFIEHLR